MIEGDVFYKMKSESNMENIKENFKDNAAIAVVDEEWSPTKLANDHSLNIEAVSQHDVN